jgi:glutamyl-tRNA reductase
MIVFLCLSGLLSPLFQYAIHHHAEVRVAETNINESKTSVSLLSTDFNRDPFNSSFTG